LEVPDDTAQTAVYDYIDPKPAEWPEANFVVGNPPFVGNKRMREVLGHGYTEALRKAYSGDVSETVDFVMYWWYKAAKLLSNGKILRFGLITTNSITQTFNRKVIEAFFNSTNYISLVYAFPDHPWVDSSDGADVRIAITVCVKGQSIGIVQNAASEKSADGIEINIEIKEREGKINSDITIGTNTASTYYLRSNSKLASQGANPLGLGFRLEENDVIKYGFDKLNLPGVIRSYAIGRDLVRRFEEKFVIDFTGFTEDEARIKYPSLYQHLLTYVKPERDLNRRETRKTNWWLFGENAPMFRSASNNIKRYIATCRTAKFRVFGFLPSSFIPDAKVVAIALDDYYYLGVLSSKIHVDWAMATGAWLGVGNDSNYNHSDCFGKFPFPNTTVEQKQQIRIIAENLDSHRKGQQALYPTLTITDMYNVMEKLRTGEALNAKDHMIHEQGLVSILLQLHKELDAAVATAYGWSANLTEQEILEKLVALNKERAAEEARGLIRWLRPEYQSPEGVEQTGIVIEEMETVATITSAELLEWPKTLSEQAQAVHRILQQQQHPISAIDLVKSFKPAKGKSKASRQLQLENLLDTFHTLGLVRKTEEGLYVR
jgi:hypothetical protein